MAITIYEGDLVFPVRLKHNKLQRDNGVVLVEESIPETYLESVITFFKAEARRSGRTPTPQFLTNMISSTLEHFERSYTEHVSEVGTGSRNEKHFMYQLQLRSNRSIVMAKPETFAFTGVK